MNPINQVSSASSSTPNIEQKTLSGAESKNLNQRDQFEPGTKKEMNAAYLKFTLSPKISFETEKNSPLLNAQFAADFGKNVTQQAIQFPNGIFKQGEKIKEEDLNKMGENQNIPPSFLEYAKNRGILSPQAAMGQLQHYIATLPLDRKAPFSELVNQGAQWAKESGHDPASPTGQSQIALGIIFSPNSTPIEKGLGLDLFMATSRFLENAPQ